MNTSALKEDHLLNTRNEIWLNYEIKDIHSADLRAQFDYLRTKSQAPIRLCIHSLGGDSDASAAISELIQQYGNVEAYLMSRAGSGASMIYASCSRRFTYKYGQLGVHNAAGQFDAGMYNTNDFKFHLAQLERCNRDLCEIYAAASNKSYQWWRKLLNRTPDAHWFTAQELVSIGMAEMIAEPK